MARIRLGKISEHTTQTTGLLGDQGWFSAISLLQHLNLSAYPQENSYLEADGERLWSYTQTRQR